MFQGGGSPPGMRRGAVEAPPPKRPKERCPSLQESPQPIDDKNIPPLPEADDADLSFKVFFDLMARKVNEILLVSSPYDAFIMEEDGRLAERIIQEYQGLNLSRPPRFNQVPTAAEALEELSHKRFDLAITMPRLDDMDAFDFGWAVKKLYPEIPVFLLTHNTSSILMDQLNQKMLDSTSIDNIFVWGGNADLLLALVKSVEDRWNVDYDTRRAGVRVVILVEDSPFYLSSLLPLLYKELVIQTQELIKRSLNEEHRILRMRARPKVLVAGTFEEAMELYRRFKPYLLTVISDVRFPRGGNVDPRAGYRLLTHIHEESPDLPLLMLSSEEENRRLAGRAGASFLNKNEPSLHADIRLFFEQRLGFGDFVFRMPDGSVVGRASTLREMEEILPSIPDESVFQHALHNDFSTWLMARSEIRLASYLRGIRATDFPNPGAIKAHLARCIRERRLRRQKGIVTDFNADDFDPETEFLKIGRGSLGGKARGLAFMMTLLRESTALQQKYPEVTIRVPKTLVISTEGFDAFISENGFEDFAETTLSDDEIMRTFVEGRFPDWLRSDLELYLSHVSHPLAVRSSSLLEDAQFRPFAGMYRTYMLPNTHPELEVRLERLIRAVKLVYASTYLEVPRVYAKSTGQGIREEKMAVIVQQLTGSRHEDYFYPAFSGVAQSYNFYPISYMKPEEGVAHVALGLGKTVVEGLTALRFSPKYPQFLPQFSSVDDILKNAQRFFFALKMTVDPGEDEFGRDGMLVRLDVDDFSHHPPVRQLSSTYNPQDQRLRDTAIPGGHLVLTFASVLKYNAFPLPDILTDILDKGRWGMGGPVEIEFAVDFAYGDRSQPEFALLQIRPMALSRQIQEVNIGHADIERAVCYSRQAMGSSQEDRITDIVFVKPAVFDPGRTVEIARQIGDINRRITAHKRRYMLIGPGRWGSADRWLGIPVVWNDISGVCAIVETETENLKADPSQGSHFFHNITSLGIAYLTVPEDGTNFIDWQWLASLPVENHTAFVAHVRCPEGVVLKIDARSGQAVLLPPEETQAP